MTPLPFHHDVIANYVLKCCSLKSLQITLPNNIVQASLKVTQDLSKTAISVILRLNWTTSLCFEYFIPV